MVETIAQVMANEKIECLEKRLDSFKEHLDIISKILEHQEHDGVSSGDT